MPRLNPESFRRLIRRHGEVVAHFRAAAAGATNADEADWGSRVNPLSSAGGFLRGWIYERAPLASGVKVWIFGAGNQMAQSQFGVELEGESSIVWMPDEVALARPDKIVRLEQSSEPIRERHAWPVSHEMGALGPLFRLQVARSYVFAVSRLDVLSSAGISPLSGALWRLAPVSAAVTSDIGSATGELEIEWLGAPSQLPATGAAVGIEYRVRPAFYFHGQSLSPRRVSTLGPDLPRTGALSLSHPDGEGD